ncbi:nicotinamide-nucleotide adenylyltransferase [Salmonella enterica subsp. arizonae]|uniref:Nicotinamide-nucleotide adenylyltransferase n=1 Tax=Salmonella enterica subsp. arizonae TaxID=59203 RepID=A0A379TGC6_SALER|nr:nicotinamide-nucleotide adenylyltransferase [Salmonella enterica subsp. arizonae]
MLTKWRSSIPTSSPPRHFAKKYEGREHPFVQALIDEYRFDLVILLENNTPWVADGLRSLGSAVDRKAFQSLLVEMLKENNIEFVHVKEADYDGRFCAAWSW